MSPLALVARGECFQHCAGADGTIGFATKRILSRGGVSREVVGVLTIALLLCQRTQARGSGQSWLPEWTKSNTPVGGGPRQFCSAMGERESTNGGPFAVTEAECKHAPCRLRINAVADGRRFVAFGASGSDGGCFTNQRHWCKATTAWRAARNGRVRRAPEGLRGIRAIDLSRRGSVLLALDHKQFPVRHLCETASTTSRS